MLWNEIFAALYVGYDTSADFMPQFRSRAEKLIGFSKAIMNQTGEEEA